MTVALYSNSFSLVYLINWKVGIPYVKYQRSLECIVKVFKIDKRLLYIHCDVNIKSQPAGLQTALKPVVPWTVRQTH